MTATVEVLRLDIDRVKYPILEFIPCTRVEVDLGPPLVITVPGHGVDELASGVLARVEEIMGCPLMVEDTPG
jgi:hypothetical protein